MGKHRFEVVANLSGKEARSPAAALDSLVERLNAYGARGAEPFGGYRIEVEEEGPPFKYRAVLKGAHCDYLLLRSNDGEG